MQSTAVYICFFCALLASAGGQEAEPFSTKTSYFTVANTDDSPLEVAGCEPRLVWLLAR